MLRKDRIGLFLLFFILLTTLLVPISAVADMNPKMAGVVYGTNRPVLNQEEENAETSKELGTKDIEKPSGKKDKIYYSITTPEEEAKKQQEEKEKMDKSLEFIRNIIIDNRKK
ncbi:MAG: hypothetical protein FJ117_17810 [Deltaproteobacteria bacterium]|nr:hypothetical protein [Deltaproteobacteria bacterium]